MTLKYHHIHVVWDKCIFLLMKGGEYQCAGDDKAQWLAIRACNCVGAVTGYHAQ